MIGFCSRDKRCDLAPPSGRAFLLILFQFMPRELHAHKAFAAALKQEPKLDRDTITEAFRQKDPEDLQTNAAACVKAQGGRALNYMVDILMRSYQAALRKSLYRWLLWSRCRTAVYMVNLLGRPAIDGRRFSPSGKWLTGLFLEPDSVALLGSMPLVKIVTSRRIENDYPQFTWTTLCIITWAKNQGWPSHWIKWPFYRTSNDRNIQKIRPFLPSRNQH
jgi:hypothetical protein